MRNKNTIYAKRTRTIVLKRDTYADHSHTVIKSNVTEDIKAGI